MQSTKQSQMKALQNKAKDLQARLGYLYLQEKAIRKERSSIETLLAAGEQEFRALQDAPEAPSAPLDEPEIVRG